MTQLIEILKKDHARIRGILETLEQTLQKDDGPPVEMCDRLFARLEQELEEHLKREEYLLSFLYSVTKKELRGYHEAREHADIRTTIHLLRDLLKEERSLSVAVIEAYGSHLIDTLREHMDQEERFVFRIAEQVLGEELLENMIQLTGSGSGAGPVGSA